MVKGVSGKRIKAGVVSLISSKVQFKLKILKVTKKSSLKAKNHNVQWRY